MRKAILLAASVFLLASVEADAKGGWIYDGARSCLFDGAVAPTRCAQFHQAITHRLKSGAVWAEWRYRWKQGDAFEVRYIPRIDMLGVSNFTIGEIFDKRINISRYPKTRAVSYSASREELVIGIPLEGYEFSVKGGGI